MCGIEVAQRAVLVPRKNRHRRVLIALAVFAVQIVLERVGATTKEPQRVPAPAARMRSQRGRAGCGNDGNVSVSDLVRGVAIALAQQPLSACPAFDDDVDGRVTVNELVFAVGNLLHGCPR